MKWHEPQTRWFRPLLVLIAGLLGGGCAIPLQPEGMIPGDFDVHTRHDASVAVDVQNSLSLKGGVTVWVEDKTPDPQIRKAVEESVRKSGVFSQVVPLKDHPRYLLKISGIKATVESGGLGVPSKASFMASWELVDTQSKNTVWKDASITYHKCSLSDYDGTVGVNQLALQRAIGDNIKMEIGEMSHARLE